MKVWYLDDADLPAEFHTIRAIFMPKREPRPILLPNNLKKSDRGRNESLHDYMTRKGIKCFCRNCVADRKRVENANNETLV